MSRDIYVLESEFGWDVVEAWDVVDANGLPFTSYVILADGMKYVAALGFARRVRRTFFNEQLPTLHRGDEKFQTGETR